MQLTRLSLYYAAHLIITVLFIKVPQHK